MLKGQQNCTLRFLNEKELNIASLLTVKRKQSIIINKQIDKRLVQNCSYLIISLKINRFILFSSYKKPSRKIYKTFSIHMGSFSHAIKQQLFFASF